MPEEELEGPIRPCPCWPLLPLLPLPPAPCPPALPCLVRWVHMPEDELEGLVAGVKDAALRHTLQFGIGLHHAGGCGGSGRGPGR